MPPAPVDRAVQKLLVVEDQPDFASMVEVMLGRAGEGWRPHIVETLSDALSRLDEGSFDAVLLDLRLPDARDFQAVESVVARHPDVPVVVMTSHDRQVAADALDRGAQDYLLKGEITPDVLERSLRYAVSRKRAEAQARKSDVRFRAALDGSLDAVFLLRAERAPDGTLLDLVVEHVNVEGERLAGRPARELVGRAVRTLWPSSLMESLWPRYVQVLTTGQPLEEEIEVGLPGEEPHWIRHQMVRLEDGLAIAARDTTERRRAERELHAREEQLLQAQKMEAVGRLAGGIAHDFNNLLTVIRGYGDLVTRRLPPADPLRRPLGEIALAAERAAALTHQLLAFSRKQVMQPRVLALGETLERMRSLLERLIGEDVHLSTRCPAGLGSVRADPAQMEQVIVNLAVNARDAMPQGGELTLELANADLDAIYARNHATMQPGPYVLLTVSDTGHGMDEQTKARIFEPFFTTKEPGKGTGLGLATVYGIVKQSGGFIWVYSEPGRGTSFKVYLPRVDERPDVVPSEPPGEEGRGTETILLVEDEEALRVLLREVLESYGYRVLEASNGVDALRVAQTEPSAIHALVSDVVMPQMTGRELAERVTARRPGVKVLLMSGYAAGPETAIPAGARYIEKPFAAPALAQALRHTLDETD